LGVGLERFLGFVSYVLRSTQNGYAGLYTSVLLPGGKRRLNLLLVTQTWESGVVECLQDPSPAGSLNPHFFGFAAPIFRRRVPLAVQLYPALSHHSD
jgi:hypothetical protein